MGKPDVTGDKWEEESDWVTGMKKLSEFKNVDCKLSGFYAGEKLMSSYNFC